MASKIPEGVALEYKSSATVSKGDTAAICKAVTAFANSIGGTFVVGIKCENNEPVKLDGGVTGRSRRDWFFQILEANTFPTISSVDVLEIEAATGSYYVIVVPPSPSAPHQSQDKRYYKRHGSHSLAMEHYEIEDVRNRPKDSSAPIRLDLVARHGVGYLEIRNTHPSNSVRNTICEIDSNFEFDRECVESLGQRGLREMRPASDKYFLLDGMAVMLEKNPEATINAEVSYEFLGSELQESFAFFIGDFAYSSVFQSHSERALEGIVKGIDGLSREIQHLGRKLDVIEKIADGSGLRVSARTLNTLKGFDFKFSPYEFDYDGYAIILDITIQEALSLHRVFGTINHPLRRREIYEGLSPELREKFESRFFVDFGQE